MKKNIIFFLMIILILSNCQSLVKKDSSIPIKRIALISFYADKRILNLTKDNNVEVDLSLGDSIIFSNLKKEEVIFIDKVVNQAIQLVINNWVTALAVKLIPPAEYLNSPSYLNFFAAEDNAFDFEDKANLIEKYFSSPFRYKVIPLQQIVKGDLGNGLFSELKSYNDLGNLAINLKVNSVMIIKSKIGYEEKSNNLFAKLVLQILLINEKGEEIINTRGLNKGRGLSFIGARLEVGEAENQLLLSDANLKKFLALYSQAIRFITKSF